MSDADAKIVGFHGERINDRGTPEALVTMAREILELAERGELVGLAVAMVRRNAEVGTMVYARHTRHLLLAGTVYLQQDIARE